MAILWWIATGTHKKMESDVAFKYTGEAFWIRQLMQGEVPLEIYHVQLQFLILGLGLILSTLFFFGELVFNKHRKHTVRNPSVSSTQNEERISAIKIDPDISQPKSRSSVSAIEIVPDISENLRNLRQKQFR